MDETPPKVQTLARRVHELFAPYTQVVQAGSREPFKPQILREFDQWFVRICPKCKSVGFEPITPENEDAALRKISRDDWVCNYCQSIPDELYQHFVPPEDDKPARRQPRRKGPAKT